MADGGSSRSLIHGCQGLSKGVRGTSSDDSGVECLGASAILRDRSVDGHNGNDAGLYDVRRSRCVSTEPEGGTTVEDEGKEGTTGRSWGCVGSSDGNRSSLSRVSISDLDGRGKLGHSSFQLPARLGVGFCGSGNLPG